MERLIVLGTGNAQAIHCYNTCYAMQNGEEYFLVDAGGGHRVHGQTVGAALCEIAAQGIQRFTGQRRQFTHVILLL